MDNFINTLIKCKKENYCKFTINNPITNEVCITFIDGNNKEMPIFFKINDFDKCTFQINHCYKLICLGENDGKNDIIKKIINENLICGTSYEYEEMISFLTNFIKEFKYSRLKTVLYKKNKLKWIFFIVSTGIEAIFGIII